MKFEWNRRDTTIAAYSFIVLALAVAFYHVLANLQAVNDWIFNLFYPIFPLFYGFVIAYLLNPILIYLERILKKFKFSSKVRPGILRSMALALTYLTTGALFVVFGFIILPEVFHSLKTMASQIHTYVNSAEQFARELISSVPQSLIQPDAAERFSDMVGQTVRDFISLLGDSIPKNAGCRLQHRCHRTADARGLIVSVYLLFSKEKFMGQLRKLLCAFLPIKRVARMFCHRPHHRFDVRPVHHRKNHRFIIIGILCYIGMVIMRMPKHRVGQLHHWNHHLLPFFGPFFGVRFRLLPHCVHFSHTSRHLLLFILALQQLDG
jgi:predicted PurR-regulated permease PerM